MCTFLFGRPTLENSIVKCACWGAILGWVISGEVFQAAFEWGRGKACGNQWGQSASLKVIPGNSLLSEKGLGRYRSYRSRPVSTSCASGWGAYGLSPSGAKVLGMDHQSRELVSRSIGEAQQGHCAFQVEIIVTPQIWLKRI